MVSEAAGFERLQGLDHAAVALVLVLQEVDPVIDHDTIGGRLDDGAQRALLDYAFPGNVRELENILERAVTLCTTGTISKYDLHMRAPAAGAAVARSGVSTDLDDQVEDVQRHAIVEALEKTRYNKTAAARLLGLTFRQLRYRIKKLGIDA